MSGILDLHFLKTQIVHSILATGANTLLLQFTILIISQYFKSNFLKLLDLDVELLKLDLGIIQQPIPPSFKY